MTVKEKIEGWLKISAQECERFKKKAASNGNYKEAIEL